MFSDQNLIWVDMEMTGLDPDNDMVIEIATIVTDSQLNTLAEGPVLAIYQPEERPRRHGRVEHLTSYQLGPGEAGQGQRRRRAQRQ